MAKKVKQIFNKHQCAFFIFAFVVIYNFIVVRNFNFCTVDEVTYTYHLVNFDIGFCTKLLPGAIFDILSPTTNVTAVNIYFNILYHAFLIAVALLLEKFIYSFDKDNRATALLLIMFFICGPATFSIHAYQFGMLDTYWLFFAVALIVFIQNKYLKWLVPLIFIGSILIHISVIVSFIPFFLLIVLYEASRSKEKRKSNIALFIICFVTTAVTLTYFVAFEESNVLLSVEEFRDFLSSRNKSEWETYTTYYEYALYKLDSIDNVDENFSQVMLVNGDGAFANIINTVWAQFYYIFQSFSINHKLLLFWVHNVILTSPVIVFIYKYLISYIKSEKTNRLNRFVLCCSLLLLPLTFAASTLFSPDINRWYGHSFISLFAFVIYVIYRNNIDGEPTNLNECIKKNSHFKILVYLVLYSLYIVSPYY